MRRAGFGLVLSRRRVSMGIPSPRVLLSRIPSSGWLSRPSSRASALGRLLSQAPEWAHYFGLIGGWLISRFGANF